MKNLDTIIDGVKVNAKAAAAVLSKKAADLYDASKHRISAETLKRAIGKKLIELGKLTYKATTQNVDMAEDIAKVVAEITELKDNLALVNEHIASIKNQKICPECENKVPNVSSFCNICGHKFEEPAAEPVQEATETVEEVVEEAKDTAGEAAETAAELVATADKAVEEIADNAEKAAE